MLAAGEGEGGGAGQQRAAQPGPVRPDTQKKQTATYSAAVFICGQAEETPSLMLCLRGDLRLRFKAGESANFANRTSLLARVIITVNTLRKQNTQKHIMITLGAFGDYLPSCMLISNESKPLPHTVIIILGNFLCDSAH